MTDRNAASVATFDKLAERYAAKYFELRHYDAAYARLLSGLPHGARVLDLACGPGNLCAYAASQRPDLTLLGLDLAPAMLAQARERVPGAEFRLGDCRRLDGSLGRFDAAAFCFGLSYLDDLDAEACLSGLWRLLDGGAPLLLTTITGRDREDRLERSSSGDTVHQFYRPVAQILALLDAQGFERIEQGLLPSPSAASTPTEDLVLLARRRAASAPVQAR